MVQQRRLSAPEAARFTAMVALLAIFVDAAVGHALVWENDPYWTYWITKTFLIATVFGLGTAWFGLGAGRGAAITAVHTVVLTVYYWSLSPIGLPSSPEWLDLEHTWVTGVPIHFGVIYLGYLLSLWLWRRRGVAEIEEDAGTMATTSLVLGTVIVVVAGALAALLLGDFPGVTWFVVRLLITVPFLMWWSSWAGRDLVAGLTGAVVLAFVWATYGHYLGPNGLPNLPLRIFTTAAPPAEVGFLDYRQLWLVSFPAYVVGMALVLGSAGARFRRRTAGPGRTGMATASTLSILAVLVVAAAPDEDASPDGADISVSASGPALIETGGSFSGTFAQATGELTMTAEDMGGRVTPLPPHDRFLLNATISYGGHTYDILVTKPLVSHPEGAHTTWWGIGLDVEHHGGSGIGTSEVPALTADVAAFGVGRLEVDGETAMTGIPVHVMTAQEGITRGTLELDVGEAGSGVGLDPGGHLRVVWPEHTETVENLATPRYLWGLVVLLLLLAAMAMLLRRTPER